MRPAWPSKSRPTCEDVLVLGEYKIKCELALEGRHASARPGEHHGHMEMPGKIWVTVTWREAGK
jgi:hypothetical protein